METWTRSGLGPSFLLYVCDFEHTLHSPEPQFPRLYNGTAVPYRILAGMNNKNSTVSST